MHRKREQKNLWEHSSALIDADPEKLLPPPDSSNRVPRWYLPTREFCGPKRKIVPCYGAFDDNKFTALTDLPREEAGKRNVSNPRQAKKK